MEVDKQEQESQLQQTEDYMQYMAMESSQRSEIENDTRTTQEAEPPLQDPEESLQQPMESNQRSEIVTDTDNVQEAETPLHEPEEDTLQKMREDQRSSIEKEEDKTHENSTDTDEGGSRESESAGGQSFIEPMDDKVQENEKNRNLMFNQDNDYHLDKTSLFGKKRYVSRDSIKSDSKKVVEIAKKKISFTHDKGSIKAAIDAAQDKGWKKIKIHSKHPVIAQAIWLEANSRDVETSGYKPTKEDLKQLTKVREEKEALTIKSSGEQENKAAAPHEVEPKFSPKQETTTKPLSGMGVIKEAVNKGIEEVFENNNFTDNEKTLFTKQMWEKVEHALAEGKATTPDRITESFKKNSQIDGLDEYQKNKGQDVNILEGELVNYGSSNYKHDPNKSMSYFVSIKNSDGVTRDVWGMDLKKIEINGDFKTGQSIRLESPNKEGDKNLWNIHKVSPEVDKELPKEKTPSSEMDRER